MADDLDALRRQFDRLSSFPDFRPQERIWWIYLRAEVEKVVSRLDLPELQVAYDRVKAFPENLPNERVLWLELRAAVEKALERYT